MKSYIVLILHILAIFMVGCLEQVWGQTYTKSPISSDSKANVSQLEVYGWDAFNEHQYDEAEFFFKKALSIAPEYRNAIYGLSWVYFKKNQLNKAILGFKRLFQQDFRKKECGQALFYLYLKKGKGEEAAPYLVFLPAKEQEKYKKTLFAPTKHNKKPNRTVAKKSSSKERNLLKRFFRLARLKKWVDTVRVYESMTLPKKDMATVLKVAGWAYYNIGQISKAEKLFKKWLWLQPTNQEAAYALALCCFRLDNYSCVSDIHNRFPDNKKLAHIWCTSTQKYIASLNKTRQYEKLLKVFTQYEGADCKNKNQGIEELAAWSAYKLQDYGKALQLFGNLSNKQNPPISVYQGLVASLERSGQIDKLWKYVSTLADAKEKGKRSLASDFYFRKGFPERAAYVSNRKSATYYNAHSPWFKMGYGYTYIDGDSGTSKLHVHFLPSVSIHFHPKQKLSIEFGATHLMLQSGAMDKVPWLGTPAFSFPKYSSSSIVHAISPHMAIEFQDKWNVIGIIGSTPIGYGKVGPVPLFQVSIKESGSQDRLSLFQRSVARSLLSWVGQKDPYSGKTWGRVVATGFIAKKNINLPKQWWLSIRGGYSHLWGENTWHNNEIIAGISVGKSLKNVYLSNLSYGVFSIIKHFDRNTNYYTFGHGGYFSPQFFLALGPFVHLKTDEGRRWLSDFSGSLTYLNYYEKESAFYPLSSHLKGDYPSNHSSKLGFSIKISTGYLFTSQLMTSMNFAMDRSADFTQYGIGISLTFFLYPRKGLFARDLADRGIFYEPGL